MVSALVVAASAAYFWGTNLADEDLWNHLNFGQQKLRTLAVPTIEASTPFLGQLRALFSSRELGGLSRDLAPTTSSLASLTTPTTSNG